MLSFIILASIGLSLFWFYKKRLPDSFPPGPRFPLPFVGDIFGLGLDIFPGMKKLRDKYGDIVGLYLGPTPTVILYTEQLIKETFTREEFAGRPFTNGFDEPRGKTTDGKVPGIISSNGNIWSEQRRFALRNLRDMGFGKTGMEEIVMEEIEELCKTIDNEPGMYVNMNRKFNIPVLGALWQLMTGEQLKHDDPKLLEVGRKFDQLNDAPILFFLLGQIIPGIQKVLKYFKLGDLVGAMEDIIGMAEDINNSHEKTFQEDSARDFTDVYIQKRRENKDQTLSSFHGANGKVNQNNVVVDLILGGSETTSNTLSWSILFMIMHPDIQKKVQEELDNVTGRSRLPTWEDRVSTPYTEAVLFEVQRHADILPNAVPHEAITDTKIGPYKIPKGTQVTALLSAVLSDPQYFPDPQKFDPDRFYKNGKFAPHPKMIPFCLGRRRCLGESLAKLELYDFFTGLLHRYTISKRPGATLTTERRGTASTQIYEARFIRRE